jgi:hypothetical protein
LTTSAKVVSHSSEDLSIASKMYDIIHCILFPRVCTSTMHDSRALKELEGREQIRGDGCWGNLPFASYKDLQSNRITCSTYNTRCRERDTRLRMMPMRVERGILKVHFPTTFLVLICFVHFRTSTSQRSDKKISVALPIDL